MTSLLSFQTLLFVLARSIYCLLESLAYSIWLTLFVVFPNTHIYGGNSLNGHLC